MKRIHLRHIEPPPPALHHGHPEDSRAYLLVIALAGAAFLLLMGVWALAE